MSSIKKFIKKCLIIILGINNFNYFNSLYKIQKSKYTDKEEEDLHYFLNMIKPDYNILDIGANVGIITVLLARKAFSGKVFSFEPIPNSFKIMERIMNHYKLNNVVLFNIALGSETKTVKMNMPIVENYPSDMMSYVFLGQHYNFNNTNVIAFDAKQQLLDNLTELHGIKVDAIKIDVEDYEYFSLKGASNVINNNRPIVFSELWYGTPNQINVFKLVEEWNYIILVYDNNKLVRFNPTIHYKLNFFFIPAEKISEYMSA